MSPGRLISGARTVEVPRLGVYGARVNAGNRLRWPFVARDAEFARVLGTAGQAAVILGAAGTGKSRLLGEVADHLESDGTRVLRVAGTRSLAGIPFGAFAGVVELGGDSGTPFDAMQRALESLGSGGALDMVAIAVDDAHQLDDSSAGLVLLAARSGARVLAAARRHEPCPDAIVRLWKDDLGERVDLEPLDVEHLGLVVQAALGGPLDTRSRQRVHDITGGNLLFARELLRDALEQGELVDRGGVWSWDARRVSAPGVHDLVRERLAAASDEVRLVVEHLAVGEPLAPAVVAALDSSAALAAAETDGLVVSRSSGRRRELSLLHPIYADVVRDTLGGELRSRRSAELADALDATGARRRDDRLRVAVLRLDAGRGGDPEALADAARVAGSRADLALAERLARAAVDAGGSTEHQILLADVLYWAGRHDEVRALLHRDLPIETPPALVARAALLAASSLYWGAGRFDEADAWLERAIARVGMPGALELVGQRAQMLMFAGRASESIAVGRSVLDEERADAAARLRAYAGLLPSSAVCGRIAEVDAEIPVAMGLAFGAVGDLSIYATGGIMVAAFIARMFAGGLDQIDVLAGAMHAEAVRRIDDPFRGVWSFLLGRSALTQGRLAAATAHLSDAVALLRDRDPGGMLSWALAALAQARGATSDAKGAEAAVNEIDAVHMVEMHNIDVDIELGRAWAAAARGERASAQAIAEKIGSALLDDGRLAIGAMALHDALRLGAPPGSVCAELDLAAEACDGPVIAGFALHARASRDHDFEGLLEASHVFETAGWLLHAAECAAAAGRCADEEGLHVRRREAGERAGRLAAHCGPALTPLLDTGAGRDALGTLTRREQEVALMAARGMSKREIADALFLSLRTVGNHINHIYGKLGIASRDELRVRLGSDRSAS